MKSLFSSGRADLPCLVALLLLFARGFATVCPAASGPITIATDYPHSFRYQSGERFFPMGDTAYFLIAQPTNVIAYYIDSRRAHKFNFVRMMGMADGFWPFGGTQSNPNYATISETAMQKWDWVFNYAASKDMNIELILFGYGTGGGEGLWTNTAGQNLWIDTLVSRYKNRSNLFMYTIANEFERYPNGVYAYEASDVEWAKGVAARIRTMDTVHPIGAHPSTWISDKNPFRSYNGFTQRHPQVVWPLWENSPLDVNNMQNSGGVHPSTWTGAVTYYPTNWEGVFYPVSWVTNATGIGWDFEGAGIEDSIAEDWAHGKPILNTEFAYQYETNCEPLSGFRTRQTHLPSTVRKKAWKIATAGGYFSAGFRNLATVSGFSLAVVDNFRPQQLETLYDFFTAKTKYWKMAPHLELVASHNVLLALPGKEYVAYFPRGGTNYIKLSAGTYCVEWLRPETGQYYPKSDITVSSGNTDFVPPNNPTADWVLHLTEQHETLVGYWSFDEGSGTTILDQSGYGANGTLLNGTAWTNASIKGPYALHFDAVDDQVWLGNPKQLRLTGAMTLSAWVFYRGAVTTPGTLGRIICKQTGSSSRGWELNVEESDAAGDWAFSIASNATTKVALTVDGSRYQTNRWVHVAGVYDPSVPCLKLYTNGVLGGIRTADVPTVQYNSTNDVYIGSKPSPAGNFWNGKIDEVRVYNRALSAIEIAALAAVPPPQFGTAALSSGAISFNWTGGGRLQWAPTVVGPWTEINPTPASPYSEPVILNTNRFFRLCRTNGIT